MATDENTPPRPRGRPRLTIGHDAVADAVAELFAEGGSDAVSIVDTAEKLSVSRATLYRTVPTKEDLLGILYERSTREITDKVRAAIAAIDDSRQQLIEIIQLQCEAAVEMRAYMPVFFGGGNLPRDVINRWHVWSREFEEMWRKVVVACMKDGYLHEDDPVVTTRLILGMILWVSRWYRPAESITAPQIAASVVRLLHLEQQPESGPVGKSATARQGPAGKRKR
ncbi:TetR/AcrR family transcriptional regulator [Mycobacterium antarcticum]|uniref:TetR/AcrR family transcriptional regulator n=1 Tax=unclassified Mycolicibacterium TaxID=2636767 RepID=UPI0024E08A0E|nr:MULTISPECIES: TetR/AcrR family transcriptional regulator [unclassified Mycolicibacterium]